MTYLLRHMRQARPRAHAPFIVDGGWDRELVPLEEMDSHYAFFQRYAGSCEFSETAYYARISALYRSGSTKGGSPTIEEWERRILSRYDAIYRSIKDNGFKTQDDLGEPHGIAEEIAICIGRSGDLLFLNGKHRLAMAKALELEKIPAVLVAVHREWHRENGDEKLEALNAG